MAATNGGKVSWSVPVLIGDRLYAANQNADVFVLRASPKFECLATNSIGGEPMNASLAVSDGNIFIRTDKHLWCIGERNGIPIPKMSPGRAGFGGVAGAALRARAAVLTV